MSDVARPLASTLGAALAGAAPRSAAGDNRWQLRLVISVPVTLSLSVLIYGLISYLAFTQRWDDLDRLGAGAIAGELLRAHMLAMIGLAVVAALMGVLLSQSILRPIQALVEATRQVAAGRLDLRAPELPAARELDDLSRSFNVMIANLNRSIAERNRSLMAGIPIGVLTTDMAGRVSALSPTAAEILGVEAPRLLGHTIDELAPILPRVSPALREYMSSIVNGDPDEEGAQANREFTLDGADAEQDLIVSSVVLRDSQARPFSVMFNLRESARVRDLSEHLSRADQLVTLGTMTLGLAHELRNPLAAIKGLGQLMQLEPDLPARAQDYLARMTSEVDRVDAFVRQLFDMTEQPVACPATTDLRATLSEAHSHAVAGALAAKAATVRLKWELEPLPLLTLEKKRLAQALTRIVQNAYEATPEGGTVTLRTYARRGGEEACCVQVRNTGSTIAPEDRKRVFEPFFTTKTRATGLGLTIANQIVIQNGGRLEVAVEADEVVFTARFPVARAAEATEALAAGAGAGGSRR